ncbi:hypothetical protein DVH05_003470 [Phytophthora capsici]|nr:hypothetical protein DVH05_003470 [Phytophthora capsici]|eukprot:jgi/Phyca11/505896/fgenesh2_kg.PHYCAscaffold_16_\
MAFFKLRKTEAEKAEQRMQKELARVAKAQRKRAAKEHKDQQARLKEVRNEAKRQEKKERKEAKKAQKSHVQAVKVAKQASKTRIRLARKAEKQRVRAHRRQMRRARAQARRDATGAVTAPSFSKSVSCFVCAKQFGKALHKRRHHCRQCRESCCLQCTSRTRRPVPKYGLKKPQKICVVCETLELNENVTTSQPREPADAVRALAASRTRPHSAPLPPTGVAVAAPTPRHARSTKSKGGSIWTLPIRPLLKRKKSAEQLRNRKMDLDLQIEKRALFGGRAVELQPQAIAPPAP